MCQVASMLVDAHTHFHEIPPDERAKYTGMWIIAVADDLESSAETLKLEGEHLVRCVGIHPWSVGGASSAHLDELEKLAYRGEVECIGEVGLDRRRKGFSKQLEFFRRQVKLAIDLGVPLNLHALDAWRDVLEVLDHYGAERALFHWYSGPTSLLPELEERGYFISVNPCVVFQRKHMKALEQASLEMLLTESDGPYVYRGVKLEPSMVRESLKAIAKVKGISLAEAEELVEENLMRYLSR